MVSSPRDENGRRRALTLLSAGFVVTGAVTTVLGPELPFIAARFSLSDSQLGAYFTAQFLAATLATLTSSAVITRLGFRRIIAAGYLFMAVGVTTLFSFAWPLSLVAPALFGIGTGLVIPASNLLAAEVASKPSAELNRLNACWTAGAILWPWIVALGTRRAHPQLAPLLVGGIVVVLAVTIFILLAEPPSRSQPRETKRPASAGLVCWLAILFFLYVGSENCIAGWCSSALKQVTRTAAWTLVPSIFWSGILIGRLAAPLMIRRISEFYLCAAGLICSTFGTVVVVRSDTAPWLVLGTALCGLGLSAVFPIFIGILARNFPGARGPIPGLVFASSGIGGAFLPWMVGILSSSFTSLKIGLLLPVAGTAMLLVLITIAKPMFMVAQTVITSFDETD